MPPQPTSGTRCCANIEVVPERVDSPLAAERHKISPLIEGVLDGQLSERTDAAGAVGSDTRRRYTGGVPVIAVFFGIVIRMFYREHEPEHFHAEYQGQHGKFDFSGRMIVGHITSKTALKLIREWARLHRAELQSNWAKMKAGKPLERIPPLE